MKKIVFSLWLGLFLTLAPTPAVAADKAPAWPQADELIDAAFFQASAEEQKTFKAAFAVAGGPDGLRRGPGGPSVFCAVADQPLEFHWHKAPPGAGSENLAQGYGEMTLRYQGEPLVLQRYRGEFRNGFREGRGELLAREPYIDHAYIYRGEFRQGRLEGRGVYVSTDFHPGGEAPFIYEGEFYNDTFHGQGVMTDLATGRVIHSGLWLEGFPFKGSQVKWARADRRIEQENRLAARSTTADSAGGHK
ncbi:MAG: hypothetical protein LBC90_05005 [Candidatus Adiutrix sp.]|jgi:hypothetical protein|nr:hypothetical protein [Candidatus Adiutrix sp.]